MKKFPNFNREKRSVRLQNKIRQDVLDLSAAIMYTSIEVSNVYRKKGGELTGNVVLGGTRRRVIKDPAVGYWTLTVIKGDNARV